MIEICEHVADLVGKGNLLNKVCSSVDRHSELVKDPNEVRHKISERHSEGVSRRDELGWFKHPRFGSKSNRQQITHIKSATRDETDIAS